MEQQQPDREEHRKPILYGIVFLILLMLIAGEAFAAQPAFDAPASEHLYFLGHLLVVIFAFAFGLLGAVHGYAVGAKNDGSGS